ncbi:MAG: glycosyltransferase family 1 protein [Sulfuricaulis sp.]
MMHLPITNPRVFRRLHENVIARNLIKIPVIFSVVQGYDSLLANQSKYLYFAMTPEPLGSVSTRSNAIPIIVDFGKTVDLRTFYRTYRNCPLVLISSLEVFNFLKHHTCPLNIHHFPLSLPDKYKVTSDSNFNKKYDIVISGRPNPVLMEFMRRYEQEHPSIEYLYQSWHEGVYCYISNKTGVLGTFNDRPSYMNLLRAARVCFYSTPGIDGGEKRTGGFNQVTPRLFEFLSAGCHVLARYPDNDDTDFYRLKEICPSVDTYDAFSARLEVALESPAPIAKNSDYLKKHYTSNRVTLLNQIMHHYG